jgi:hypothetical protein
VVKPRQASRDVGLFYMEIKMLGHYGKMEKNGKKMSDMIKKEMKAGKPQKQAVAMAFGMMKKPAAKSMKKK